MTFDELKMMTANGLAEIGCHGYYHQPLSERFERYLQQEQSLALSVLQDRLAINPRYYSLIQEFEKITGVPIVLNTSFNIRGEPIVHQPEQAIECFLKTGMDALFLGDYVLTKRTASAAKEMSNEQLVAAHANAAGNWITLDPSD